MIFLSAGHHKNDPGAPAVDGNTEANMTIELRDLILQQLRIRGVPKVVIDIDSESLSEYLKRIEPGDASVACEIHFNASSNPKATGIEIIVPDNPSNNEMIFAKKLCDAGALAMGIQSRGVKTEAETHRGKLGFMREKGMNLLAEVCFISNPADLQKYYAHKLDVAKLWAEILIDADAAIL